MTLDTYNASIGPGECYIQSTNFDTVAKTKSVVHTTQIHNYTLIHKLLNLKLYGVQSQ